LPPSGRQENVCDGHQELRDIVIETRSDVKHILETMESITRCIDDHDKRIRTIEIVGSTKAEEALTLVEKLTGRVASVEKICNADMAVDLAKTGWWDSIYTKVGIITGICFGIAAFVWDVIH
jgi:hypothetical protein